MRSWRKFNKKLEKQTSNTICVKGNLFDLISVVAVPLLFSLYNYYDETVTFTLYSYEYIFSKYRQEICWFTQVDSSVIVVLHVFLVFIIRIYSELVHRPYSYIWLIIIIYFVCIFCSSSWYKHIIGRYTNTMLFFLPKGLIIINEQSLK